MSQRRTCLIGQPIAHSLSPAMHNAGFQALGINARYGICEVSAAELPAVIASLRSHEWLGANVTIPHKELVLELLDELSAEARLLGAVNTVVNRQGRLYGDNTDARGLLTWMCQEGIGPGDGRGLVLGAGGAARAAVWALDRLGVRSISVLNRSPQRAEALVASLRPHVRAELDWGPLAAAAQPGQTARDVIVNATSLSHQGVTPTLDPSCYSPACVAVDLAYKETETGFMRAARAAGARAENGRGMLLHQARLAFELWTGQLPAEAVFAAALDRGVAA